MKVKTYSIDYRWFDPPDYYRGDGMEEDDNGEYVKLTDYKTLHEKYVNLLRKTNPDTNFCKTCY
mgnify:CR=1 FL=1